MDCRHGQKYLLGRFGIESASNKVEGLIVLLCAMPNYEIISNRADALPTNTGAHLDL